jgi:hypothetical protein
MVSLTSRQRPRQHSFCDSDTKVAWCPCGVSAGGSARERLVGEVPVRSCGMGAGSSRDPRQSAQVGHGLSRVSHDQTQTKLKSRHRHCPERKSPGCLHKQGLPRTDLTRPSCARDLLQRPVSALPQLNGKEEVHVPLLAVLRCRVRPFVLVFPAPRVFASRCGSSTGPRSHLQPFAQVSHDATLGYAQVIHCYLSPGHSPRRRCAQPCPQCLWKTAALFDNSKRRSALQPARLDRAGRQAKSATKRRWSKVSTACGW